MIKINLCQHCKGDLVIRNPKGFCDHLYYPKNCEVCRKDKKMKPDWEDILGNFVLGTKNDGTDYLIKYDEFLYPRLKSFISDLLAKQEEQHKMERDYIVVKDRKVAKDLVTKYKGKDLRGKWIIIAPNGLEFVSEEDIKRLPVIQKLKQQHAKEIEELNDWRIKSNDGSFELGYEGAEIDCGEKIKQLKQQHREELEGLKMKHDKPNHTDDCNDIYWCDTCDMTLDDNGECGCELVNKTIDRFNKAITNLLEQKGK